MKYLIVLLFPLLAQAEYLLGYGVGSYLGRHQLQVEWETENQKNRVLGILGYTGDKELGDIKQIAGAYLWNLEKRDYGSIQWIPLFSGFFMTYTDHQKYYLSSPSRYPTDDYYDVTGFRWGLRFSTELWFAQKKSQIIRFSLDGSLLERSLVAFFNNPSELGIFSAFWSLGFSVKFDLE